jgi:hypothetical protein
MTTHRIALVITAVIGLANLVVVVLAVVGSRKERTQ